MANVRVTRTATKPEEGIFGVNVSGISGGGGLKPVSFFNDVEFLDADTARNIATGIEKLHVQEFGLTFQQLKDLAEANDFTFAEAAALQNKTGKGFRDLLQQGLARPILDNLLQQREQQFIAALGPKQGRRALASPNSSDIAARNNIFIGVDPNVTPITSNITEQGTIQKNFLQEPIDVLKDSVAQRTGQQVLQEQAPSVAASLPGLAPPAPAPAPAPTPAPAPISLSGLNIQEGDILAAPELVNSLKRFGVLPQNIKPLPGLSFGGSSGLSGSSILGLPQPLNKISDIAAPLELARTINTTGGLANLQFTPRTSINQNTTPAFQGSGFNNFTGGFNVPDSFGISPTSSTGGLSSRSGFSTGFNPSSGFNLQQDVSVGGPPATSGSVPPVFIPPTGEEDGGIFGTIGDILSKGGDILGDILTKGGGVLGDILSGGKDVLGGAINAAQNSGVGAGDVLGALANIFATVKGRDAQEEAAKDLIRQLQQARGTEREFFETAARGLQPFIPAGIQAQNKQAAISGALGPQAQAQAFSEFQESPGTAFLREEGLKRLESGLASQGLTGSGERLKALSRFNQGLALQDLQNQFGRLGSVAGTGLQAAGGLAGVAIPAGENIAGTTTSIGLAKRARELGKQEELASGLTGLFAGV